MWFKCNPSDWLKRWPERSLEHFGTFCTLMAVAWDRQGMPDEIIQAVKLTGLPAQTIEPAWETFKSYCAPYDGQLLPLEMIDGITDYKAKVERAKTATAKRMQPQVEQNNNIVNEVVNDIDLNSDTKSSTITSTDLDKRERESRLDENRREERRERVRGGMISPTTRAHAHPPFAADLPPDDSPVSLEAIEHQAVKIFEQIYGHLPNLHGTAFIIEHVTDLTVWQDTLKRWRADGYRETSISRMVEKYQETIAAKVQAVVKADPRRGPDGRLKAVV